ncbi:MAG: antitoxin family protein [Gemmataceae bacterium]
MITTVSAVYEGGIIRPSVPLPFADGTQVQVTVAVNPADLPAPDPEEARERIMAIIALSDPNGPPEDTARNHDKYLYGGPEGAR